MVDIEFWKMTSRLFYAAKLDKYEDRGQALRVGHGYYYVDLTTEPEVDNASQLGINEDIIKICDIRLWFMLCFTN